MKKILLTSVILVLIFKIYLVLKYNITLTFNSDDINYLNSAKTLIKTGMLTYKYSDLPTVFITPIYPLFLGVILKIFGDNQLAELIIRFVQIGLSTFNLYLLYIIAKKIMDRNMAYIAVLLANIYIPNITTPLYFISETLFVSLFLISIKISLDLKDSFNIKNITKFSILWGLSILTRPMIAIIPLIIFIWYLVICKINFIVLLKYGIYAGIIFILIMCPWWIRNYKTFNEFIPLTKSIGNPMLQGAFINYEVNKSDIVEYREKKDIYELDDMEKNAAKRIAREGFKKDFYKYLKWYTIDKTKKLWDTPFYWRYIWRINNRIAFSIHYIYMIGLLGIILFLRRDKTSVLVLMMIIYINIICCITYSFSRYSYPFMNFIIIYFAALLYKTKAFLRKS